MNALDLVILLVLVSAAVGGWRLGLLARVFVWAGLALGLIVGVQFVQRVVTSFGGTSPDDRATVAVLFLLLSATLGQAAGLGVGVLVHRHFGESRPLPGRDRVAGATLGVAGVLLLVWMTIPSLATARGWPARLARGSAIVGVVNDFAPRQPERFAAVGRAVTEAPYPSALGQLEDPPDPGPPPDLAISDVIDQKVRQSIVKVAGPACNHVQQGTGWVFEHGRVVTNAHVVAGETKTTVVDAHGSDRAAFVVEFDPARDLAVLDVPDLDAPPLTLATGAVGDIGAVYGYPDGGPLTAAPAGVAERIEAVGSSIYGTGRVARNVYVLGATLTGGYSGGPLVDLEGNVIGVAFAIDAAHESTGFALAEDEVGAALAAVGSRRVDTGKCLVD